MKKIFLQVILCLLPFSIYAQNNSEKWEDEIAAFEKTDEQKQFPENAILFTGSSSIRLWNNLEQSFPGKNIIKRGFGGSETSDLVFFYDRIILKYKPAEIVIYTGENDIAVSYKSPQIVFNDFKILIEKIHKDLPKAKVIIISPKPSPSRWNKVKEIKEVNQMLSAYLTKTKYATFVNVFDEMLNKTGHPRSELFQSDNLHLNASGYDLWKRILEKYL